MLRIFVFCGLFRLFRMPNDGLFSPHKATGAGFTSGSGYDIMDGMEGPRRDHREAMKQNGRDE